MPRVAYISGPMTGLPDWNRPALAKAAKALRKKGWVVLNPAEHDAGSVQIRKHHMRHDIQAVLLADVVFKLPGWLGSRGSVLEVLVAEALELEIHHWNPAKVPKP